MFCGLLRPTAGVVRVNGVDVQADPMSVRQVTGYIPDNPYLYERLTADEFLDFMGDLYRVAEPRAAKKEKLLALFGLADSRHALIRELSHGMRQRLVYASAFLHEPRVLFVDEPFTGLDPRSIRLIKNLLREKARAGLTVFLTTHILALAEDIADRAGIIRDGEMIAVGTLDELRAQAKKSGRLEDVFLSLTGEDGAQP
jgi:ABC-2 type transport system ATP-binding protein